MKPIRIELPARASECKPYCQLGTSACPPEDLILDISTNGFQSNILLMDEAMLLAIRHVISQYLELGE